MVVVFGGARALSAHSLRIAMSRTRVSVFFFQDVGNGNLVCFRVVCRMVGTGFVFWEYEKAVECSETEVETLSVLDKVGGLQ